MTGIVQSNYGVILLGGGSISPADVAYARQFGQDFVCADGGANMALELGLDPVAILGDLDSASPQALARWPDRVHQIQEQDSTDFEKCLIHIDAPFYLALGFTGKRLDHTLAAMNALIAHKRRRVVLIAEDDVIFRAPPMFALDLEAGARVSLFPMGPSGGRSTGLKWQIDGLKMSPATRIGTSNIALGKVTLEIAGDMLVMLEKPHLFQALKALADPTS
jgi:thiamine pyrophosphokinase